MKRFLKLTATLRPTCSSAGMVVNPAVSEVSMMTFLLMARNRALKSHPNESADRTGLPRLTTIWPLATFFHRRCA